MIRKTKTQPGRATTHGRWQRIALAAVAGLACQFAFLVVYQGVLAEHYTRRAQDAVAARKPSDAAVWARRALSLNPHQGYAAFFLGAAQAQQGRTSQAVESFQRALHTMAHGARPLSELAVCERKLGNSTAEADHLAASLAIEPVGANKDTSVARFAGLRLEQGQWADGVARLHSALNDSPRSLVLFDRLAVACERTGASDIAVAATLALLASPDLAGAVCERLLRLSRFAGQTPVIARALREVESGLRPDDPRRAPVADFLKNLAAGGR